MTPEEKLANLIMAMKTELYERTDEIDAADAEDWNSVLLGWALGKGLLPKDALAFRKYIQSDSRLIH